jgi:hypothetical protein
VTDMTQEEYLQQGGAACPFCRSDNIEVVEGSELSEQEVSGCEGRTAIEGNRCGACGKYWFDVYQLTGYIKPYVGEK